MITCSTLSGKAVCCLVWDMNKAENDAYLEKALSGIPEHFSALFMSHTRQHTAFPLRVEQVIIPS